MPFSIVITREGISDAVTAVPSNWVQDGVLYWPRTKKKQEQETIRSKEDSMPDKNWRKQMCRVKASGIETFEEAFRLEEIYSKFDDTEDEQRYFYNLKHKKAKYHDSVLDLNSEFKKSVPPKSIDKVVILSNEKYESPMKTPKNKIQKTAASTSKNRQSNGDEINKSPKQLDCSSPKQSQKNIEIVNKHTQDKTEFATATQESDEPDNANEDNNIEVSTVNIDTTPHVETICTSNSEDLVTYLTTEYNKLYDENIKLKDILNNISKYNENVEHKFAAINVRLDNIMNVLERKTIPANDSIPADPFKDIICPDLTFPIETLQDLDILEKRLQDKNLEKRLVNKFSKLSGTDGLQKLQKIGITVLSHIIKDECLSLCSWKGIKGCNKIPFVNYLNIREMIYKIIHLADKTCSIKDIDAFLQYSAIKHCKQRLKTNISKLSSPKPGPSKEKIQNVEDNTMASELVNPAAEIDPNNEGPTIEENIVTKEDVVENEGSTIEENIVTKESATEYYVVENEGAAAKIEGKNEKREKLVPTEIA